MDHHLEPGESQAPGHPVERFPCRSLRADDAGLTTVEYVIILALIAIAAIGAWDVFGGSIELQARGSSTTVGGLPR